MHSEKQIQLVPKILAFFLLCAFSTYADDELQPPQTLAQLIEYCLHHSNENSVSEADVSVQKSITSAAELAKWLPQVDLYASFQSFHYSDAVIPKNGQLITNSGTNPIVGTTVSYDLQKLFGPESEVAQAQEDRSRITHAISKRNIIRVVKKTFAALQATQLDIAAIQKSLKDLEKVEHVLKRQKAIGVFTEVEEQRYRVERELLISDLNTREVDQTTLLSAIANMMNLPLEEVKGKLESIRESPKLIYPEALSKISAGSIGTDPLMMQSLSADYRVSKREYESYSTFPLPTVFAKTYHQWPTMPGSDGQSQVVEVGFNLNVTAIFHRLDQKEEIRERLGKNEKLREKNLLEYRNSVRQAMNQMRRHLVESESLKKINQELHGSLDRYLGYYSQKRIDTLMIFDVSLKALVATQREISNRLALAVLDADLEYLLGGVPQ